jgi:hypothetical protein
LVVDLGADERLWWTSHRNGRRRKEIMPSYRRLNPDELPSEYADGTANVTTRERERGDNRGGLHHVVIVAVVE